MAMVKDRLGNGIAWVLVGLSIGFVGGVYYMHGNEPFFVPGESDPQFVRFTTEVVDLEGGWKRGGGAYAGIDSAVHSDSPLWGYDMSKPTDAVKAEVFRLYMQYYQSLRIHDLPPAIGFIVYDFGINAGPSRSVKAVQSLVFKNSRDVDGIMGARTVEAIRKYTGGGLPLSLTFLRLRYYADLARQPRFTRDFSGWVTRSKRALVFSQGAN